jgi:hypothetical protein
MVLLSLSSFQLFIEKAGISKGKVMLIAKSSPARPKATANHEGIFSGSHEKKFKGDCNMQGVLQYTGTLPKRPSFICHLNRKGRRYSRTRFHKFLFF